MLGMGITLKFEDFLNIMKFPKWAATGILLQYTVMPLTGWALGYLFKLPVPLAVGLVLVSCCPGGTASNVISYLARANVALSVTMTAFSTILAVVMTPLLTTWLAGNRVEVDTLGLLWSTFQVVILPVTIGLLLHQYAGKMTEKVMPVFPFIAVIVITLIVASIIGAGKEKIIQSGIPLMGAVVSLHSIGFLAGYWLSQYINKNKAVSRTVSIEVGMQNSGLGVVLARQNFANPATAIPSALSSLTHCLIGSFVAGLWRKKQSEEKKPEAAEPMEPIY